MQAWVYRGLSVTCNNSGIHGGSSHNRLFAATKRDAWSRSFYSWDRYGICPQIRLYSSTPGWLLPEPLFFFWFLLNYTSAAFPFSYLIDTGNGGGGCCSGDGKVLCWAAFSSSSSSLPDIL